MDGYLAALVRHDAGSLPVAPEVRFTENGVEIPLGEALWVTISGLGGYRHDFYEPATGGVSTFVTMSENGTPGYLTIRLRVDRNRLTEIETVVNRGAPNASHPPAYEPIWDEIAPPSTRLTREQLMEGVIGYMRAVAFADGKLARFAETCIRLENGNVMALGPHDKSLANPLAAEQRDDDRGAAVRRTLGMGCSEQRIRFHHEVRQSALSHRRRGASDSFRRVQFSTQGHGQGCHDRRQDVSDDAEHPMAE